PPVLPTLSLPDALPICVKLRLSFSTGGSHMRRSLLAIVLLCLPLGAVAEEFARWHIPWEKTRPRDPIVDEAGIVWFVGQGGHYVDRKSTRLNSSHVKSS